MSPELSSSAPSAKPMWLKVIVGVAGVAVVIYLGALTRNAVKQYEYIGRPTERVYTITISGEGKVTAKPDIGQVSLGVQVEKPTVTEATKENTTKMNALIAALKVLGIAEEDIRTTNYSLNPQYEWPNGRQELRGYAVYQDVQVKVRDLEKVGEVISKAAEVGANQVGGLTFTIDDPEEYRQQAREKALANAKQKAEALAQSAGVQLGKLVEFNEGASNVPNPVYYLDAARTGYGGGSAAPEIQSGSQDVIVNVNVTYEVL